MNPQQARAVFLQYFPLVMENFQTQIIADSIRTDYAATTKEFSIQDLPLHQMWQQTGTVETFQHQEAFVDVKLLITASPNYNPHYKLWVFEFSPSTDNSYYFLWCERGLSVEYFHSPELCLPALDGNEAVENTFEKPIDNSIE